MKSKKMSLEDIIAIENAVKGNPTIKWNKKDEKRYNYEGPYPDDIEDIAANCAYVLASDGIDLYAFAEENDDGEWLIDIDGNGEFKWYSFVGGRLYPIDDTDDWC